MVALPTTNGITTFNMVELAPYFKDDPLANLRINLFQQRGNDGDLSKGHDLGLQFSQVVLSSSSIVQDVAHILLGLQTTPP